MRQRRRQLSQRRWQSSSPSMRALLYCRSVPGLLVGVAAVGAAAAGGDGGRKLRVLAPAGQRRGPQGDLDHGDLDAYLPRSAETLQRSKVAWCPMFAVHSQPVSPQRTKTYSSTRAHKLLVGLEWRRWRVLQYCNDGNTPIRSSTHVYVRRRHHQRGLQHYQVWGCFRNIGTSTW